MYSIRKGNWKLEFCSDGGGVHYKESKGGLLSDIITQKQGEDMSSMQLYDLAKDIGEKDNVYEKHPEVVAELRDLLIKQLREGRSTPGTVQKNTPPNGPWTGLQWLNLG